MNATIAGRCFWREYRTGRSFWIAMLVLTVGMQLFCLAADSFWGLHMSRQALWGIALIMPLIYVVGWAATAFSREHETGGFALLNALPTTFAPIWLGKVGFTLVSSCLLGLSLAGITMAFGGRPQIDAVSLAIWGSWLMTLAGIGTCCSQWIKRPLTATAVTGGVVATIAFWISNGSMEVHDRINWLNQGSLFLFGVLALALSYGQGRPWLQDRIRWSLPRLARASRGFAEGKDGGGTWRAQLVRLIWVSWRRVGVVSLAMLVLVPLSVMTVGPGGLWTSLAMLVLLAWPIQLGVTLFYCEHDPHHARFLISQGISPRRIWWSRQLIGAAILVGVSLVIMIMLDGAPNDPASAMMVETNHAYWPYVVLAYFSGQLISISLRSTLVSFALASLLALLVIGWTAICTRLDIPAWISLAIPALGMLATSRLRAKPWLLEWDTLWKWRAPASVLAGTLCLLVTAFAVHRTTEIPYVASPVDAIEFAARFDNRFDTVAAEQVESAAIALSSRPWETASRYADESLQTVRQGVGTAIAWSSLPLPILAEESTALEEAAELLAPDLDAAVDAAHGLYPSTRWTMSAAVDTDLYNVRRLGQLYIARARAQQKRGESTAALADFHRALHLALQLRRGGAPMAWLMAAQLETAALDNLVFWAADPTQDADEIASLARALVRYWSEEPAWTTPLTVEYIVTLRFIDGLPGSLEAMPIAPQQASMAYAMLLCPWEKLRMQRLLNAEGARNGQLPVSIQHEMDGWNSQLFAPLQWHRTTLPVPASRRQWLSSSMAELQEGRAAALLRLLMIEHRARTGQYPAESAAGTVPTDIIRQADALVQQLRESGASDAITYLDCRPFHYRRLSEATLDRYAEFHEPLGNVPVDAAREWALLTEGRTFPLPAP